VSQGKLAEAYVEIGADSAKLDRQLATEKSKISKWTEGVSAVASQIGLGVSLGAVASGVGNAFKSAIMGAADLGETMSKVDVVFGKSNGTVTAFADEMAAKFGANKQVMLDAAASIGLVGKAAGLSQPQAASMSTALARLADDASSFYNVPLEEALSTIKSALVGESEPIRKFGVLLNEDAVKAEALRMGLVGVGEALTEQAKVMARVSLIQKGMTDATGDHERTMGSFTNQIREMGGRLQNIGTSIGQILLPIGVTVVTAFNVVIGAIEGVIKKLQDLGDWFQGTGSEAAEAAKQIEEATKEWSGTGGSDFTANAGVMTPAQQAKAREDKAQETAKSQREAEIIKKRVEVIQKEHELETTKEANRQKDLAFLKERRLNSFISYEKGPDGKVREVVANSARPQLDAIRAEQDAARLKSSPERLGSIAMGRAGGVLGAIAQLRQDALGGAGILGNMLFKDKPQAARALTGVTDVESYRRAAQDSILEGSAQDTQKKLLDENKKQVSELKAIKDQLIKQTKGVVARAVYG
jgi:hypothetical protein